MGMTFEELAVGEYFRLNGNAYVKRSSRTAYLIRYDRTFYIGKAERVAPIAPAEVAKYI